MRGVPAWAMLTLTLAGVAHAQTDEIQVYDGEIAPPGFLSLSWHNNFTPSGRPVPEHTGGVAPGTR
jgi:hypothetical protein